MRLTGNSGAEAPPSLPEPAPQSSIAGKLLHGAFSVLTSPARLLPKREIAEGVSLIKGLADAIKKGPDRTQGFFIEDDRSFDVLKTADAYGVTLEMFEAILWRRQYLTMRSAYLAFILGWIFFFAWLIRLVNLPYNAGFLVLMIEYAPFCLVFFLLSFRSALLNFQIRTRRLATAGEYLRTSERFWPQ